jgi:hypothetical protein
MRSGYQRPVILVLVGTGLDELSDGQVDGLATTREAAGAM